MNKKISLGLALSLIAIASAVTFILTSFFSLQSFNEKVVDVNEKSKKYNSLQVLDSYVRENYLGDINENDLSDGILKGYISGLDDKYSRYLTEEEYLSEQSEDEGQLVGLGLTLSKDDNGYIRIAEIMQDSPVVDAGLQVGDVITIIDGVDVLAAGFEESVESMRGTEGTEIKLTIRRDGIDKDYTFTRRSIEMITVSGEMINERVGYIKISGFKKNTPQQFIDTLERLTSNGAKAIIFDVRDNGGGIVDSLSDCVDPLLPEGVIATAEYKDGHSETLVYSDAAKLDIPMVVLVNKNTASAAELFAASLRDFGGAVLVGERTYGKGVMQQTTEFDKKGAVVLTVAKYKTAVSECYDGIGLTPDYTVENTFEEYDEQKNRAIDAAMSLLGQ
ncbi:MULTISPECIES: S41 family peptidase [Ruminococcus]|uniref:Carboxyl-terminal processing protease n=1 Tax=Ruminococcus flavefaciens TaxID=1265 RepID=A0A1M7IJH8_RUMFL|nr:MULTISPECIES: S41 family peptidase [Ruminococcus]MCR4795028.1 S41 family peptidase [Ruminococcus sp.]SHM40881.1 carboxyl-terminal processing protease [Ruminococcus flavefaciens]